MARELVRPGADGLLLEAIRSDLLVVLLRHDPAGSRDVGGAEEDGEVEERLLEDEANRAVVHDLDALGFLLEDVGLGAAVVLVAELHVLRSDWVAVVELDALAQGERGALGVGGDRGVLGQRRVVVERRALILDERVVDRGEEVVRGGGSVVLLRIEPARRESGVPREDQLALGRGAGR